MRKRVKISYLEIYLFFTLNAFGEIPFNIRLPYTGGEEWGITCEYDGKYFNEPDPLCIHHTGTDSKALDFNLSGTTDCGKSIRAIAGGKIIEVVYSEE